MTPVRPLALCLSLAVLSGCAAITNVDKIGNEYAQHSYSRNFWWPNYDRAIFCDDLDGDGFCPKKGRETYTVIAQESAGQGAAKAAVGNMPLALGLGLGLANIPKSTSSMQQRVFDSPTISTFNGNVKYVPIQ